MQTRFPFRSLRKKVGLSLEILSSLCREDIAVLSRLESAKRFPFRKTQDRIEETLHAVERVRAAFPGIPLDLRGLRWLKEENQSVRIRVRGGPVLVYAVRSPNREVAGGMARGTGESSRGVCSRADGNHSVIARRTRGPGHALARPAASK